MFFRFLEFPSLAFLMSKVAPEEYSESSASTLILCSTTELGSTRHDDEGTHSALFTRSNDGPVSSRQGTTHRQLVMFYLKMLKRTFIQITCSFARNNII